MFKQDLLSWVRVLGKKQHRSRERYRNAVRSFKKRHRQAGKRAAWAEATS